MIYYCFGLSQFNNSHNLTKTCDFISSYFSINLSQLVIQFDIKNSKIDINCVNKQSPIKILTYSDEFIIFYDICYEGFCIENSQNSHFFFL